MGTLGKHWKRPPITEETREKIIKNNSKFWLGKKFSESHKRKLKENHKGTLGKKWNINTRLKIANSHKGSKSHFWKNGINNLRNTIRNSVEFKIWRESVFERDNYICQSCGKRGGKLEAHHILSFASFPHKRFDISNGITLCKDCHKKTNNYAKYI